MNCNTEDNYSGYWSIYSVSHTFLICTTTCATHSFKSQSDDQTLKNNLNIVGTGVVYCMTMTIHLAKSGFAKTLAETLVMD